MSDPIVTALIAAAAALLVSGVINSIQQSRARAEERRKDDLRYRREHLIEPVIRFTDDLLAWVSETYWTHTERVLEEALSKAAARVSGTGEQNSEVYGASIFTGGLQERLVNLRNREAAIDARVIALNDSKLTESFRALSLQIENVGSAAMAKGGFGAAREEAQKASALGAEVITAVLRLSKNT